MIHTLSKCNSKAIHLLIQLHSLVFTFNSVIKEQLCCMHLATQKLPSTHKLTLTLTFTLTLRLTLCKEWAWPVHSAHSCNAIRPCWHAVRSMKCWSVRDECGLKAASSAFALLRFISQWFCRAGIVLRRMR